jgi:hypothetical protein
MAKKKVEGSMEGGVEVDGCREETFTESIQLSRGKNLQLLYVLNRYFLCLRSSREQSSQAQASGAMPRQA